MAISKIKLLTVIFIGILLLTINAMYRPPTYSDPEIEYRYVPRTFDDEMDDRGYVSDIFATMFSEQSPWVFSKKNFDRIKQGQVNAFFISQY